MVKVLTYDIPDYKIKLKIRQLQVMGKKIQGKLMYQSIPSLTIPPPPGNFSDELIPHPPGKNGVQNPHPRAYKNELKPHLRGHFPHLFAMKT